MFPPRTREVLAALLLALLPAAAARGDAVAEYLERHGLKQLLAVHLEQQLEGLAGEERDELVLRLAGLYSELLESATDPQLLVYLEEKSRQLLAAATSDSGAELRLALLRGSYRAAERIAENHRLRQASPQDVERAAETLTGIIPDLNQLRAQVTERHKSLDRRLGRATGREAAVLTQQVERYDRLAHACTFFAAWAQYYQSWLNQRRENARVAEGLFAELLGTESSRPRPEEISLDLRGVEAVARSILGMAACKSLTSSAPTALEWLRLLESPSAFADVRAQVPAWKVAILLEHGEYAQAQEVLEAYKGGGGATPTAWLRLAAAHALEARGRSEPAGDLARYAMTSLAAHGELEQVLDLAARYGVEALGTEGFAFRYVTGVRHYEAARHAHGDDRPTLDPALVALYEQASAAFGAAVGEADAPRYPEAAASSRWLVGWCRYFQSRFAETRATFEAAASHLEPSEAAEAMWMAVVCLERVVKDDPSPEGNEELAALIDRVLSAYPSSLHAPKLILRRAVARDEVSPEVVESLRSVPPDSDVYDAAMQRAAWVLYQLFRKASGEERIAYGNEYLAVAVPTVGGWEGRVDLSDGEAVRRYLARSRQVLEVALAEGINRLSAAARVLDDLDALREKGVDLTANLDETDFRRVQLLVASANPTAAAEVVERLRARGRGSPWARHAVRAVFERALARWRGAEHQGLADRTDLELVVHLGRMILEEFADRPELHLQEGMLAYHATVAEALTALWQRSGDPRQADDALELHEKVLQVRPNDAASLRSAATLSESLGRAARAVECWRTLVAGSTAGTPEWFDARFHLISLLAESDPARARTVMDQHKQLNPGYGPEPWASRYEALDRRIPPAPPGETSDVPGREPA